MIRHNGVVDPTLANQLEGKVRQRLNLMATTA